MGQKEKLIEQLERLSGKKVILKEEGLSYDADSERNFKNELNLLIKKHSTSLDETQIGTVLEDVKTELITGENLSSQEGIIKEAEMGPTVELQQALKNMGPEVEDGYYAISDNILPLLKGLQGQSGINPSQELEDEIKIFYKIYTLFQKSQLGKYL